MLNLSIHQTLKRTNPRGQLPGRWASSQKRPADGALANRDSSRPRFGNSQFASRQPNDYQQSREQGQRQQPSQWSVNANANNNRGWTNNPNQNSFSRRQGDSVQGQSNAGRNDSGSSINGQSRGWGGGGRGRASWAPEVRGTIQSSQPGLAANGVLERRVGKLEAEMGKMEAEMVANYELTDTALNRTNAAAVIIDSLPFGTCNNNQPAVTVVRELVETMGGPDSIVSLAFFLGGGQAPAPGTFARIKAIFKSEELAFEFRAEATAARRRRELPWTTAYVSNDPTKGTKVRIEILQQLAKAAQATVEGRDAEILVSKFEVRPMMLFKMGGRIYKRVPYTEALLRFGRLVDPKAYELARKIGGREYEGRMGTVFGI